MTIIEVLQKHKVLRPDFDQNKPFQINLSRDGHKETIQNIISAIEEYSKCCNDLQSQVAGELRDSEMWLVLRMDHKGIHLHMPNEKHIALFGAFFKRSPEIFEIVKMFVSKEKRG